MEGTGYVPAAASEPNPQATTTEEEEAFTGMMPPPTFITSPTSSSDDDDLPFAAAPAPAPIPYDFAVDSSFLGVNTFGFQQQQQQAPTFDTTAAAAAEPTAAEATEPPPLMPAPPDVNVPVDTTAAAPTREQIDAMLFGGTAGTNSAPEPAPAPAPFPAPFPSDWYYHDVEQTNADRDATGGGNGVDPEAAIPTTTTTTEEDNDETLYEHVYCGSYEGRLHVTHKGFHFEPYSPYVIPDPATPHTIAFSDLTHKQFALNHVDAAISNYATRVTFFDLQLGVLPSKEVVFHMSRHDEYLRLQDDLVERGQYELPEEVPLEHPDDEPEIAPGFEAEDYDFMPETEAQDGDFQEEEMEGQYYDSAGDEDVEWSDVDDDSDVNEDDELEQQRQHEQDMAWSTGQDSSTEPPDPSLAPNTTYYPVFVKSQIGTLVLTHQHLQFVPDQPTAACPTKILPWTSFTGRPFASPRNYPQATMRFHYFTTRGPNKKVVFRMTSHDVLEALHRDAQARMRPWKTAPREKIYVPPVARRAPPPMPTVYNRGDGSPGMRKRYPTTKRGWRKPRFRWTPPLPQDYDENQKKKQLQKSLRKSAGAAGLGGVDSTEFTVAGTVTGRSGSYDSDDDSYIDYDVAVPLVRATRQRFHKDDDSPRRQLVLFLAYCGIITVFGLILSILFGYFFGPRRTNYADNQYIRTKSPFSIGRDYLGTHAPTVMITNAPTTLGPTKMPTTQAPTTLSPTQAPSTAAPSQAAEVVNAIFAGLRETRPPDTEAERHGSNFTLDVHNNSAIAVVTFDDPEIHTVAPTIKGTSGGLEEFTNALRETQPPDVNREADLDLAETAAPTRSNKTEMELLMDASFDGGEAIRTTGTAEQAAYLLISVSGVMQDSPSDARILEKFALSTFYYATGGPDWKEGSASWADLDSNDCVKQHIVCDDDNDQATIWIEMPNNNVQGSIPADLALLSRLQHLDLAGNDLQGTIPSQLGLLTDLKLLDLSNNPNLQGPLPSEIQNLPNLETLKVDFPILS